MEQHHYFPAGNVERGARYEWRQGYSRILPSGGTTQPWLTKREAQRQARAEGGKAVFHETETAARKAATAEPAENAGLKNYPEED